MPWQPSSNGRRASGVALVPEMLERGMKVGIGLDDQACTDVSDPWQNMRMGIAMQRARTKDPLSMMPERVLRLHTLGGAEILGVADRVGSLEVGKFADFVVVRSEEHTSELQSLMRISYAVFCLKKKTISACMMTSHPTPHNAT